MRFFGFGGPSGSENLDLGAGLPPPPNTADPTPRPPPKTGARPPTHPPTSPAPLKPLPTRPAPPRPAPPGVFLPRHGRARGPHRHGREDLVHGVHPAPPGQGHGGPRHPVGVGGGGLVGGGLIGWGVIGGRLIVLFGGLEDLLIRWVWLLTKGVGLRFGGPAHPVGLGVGWGVDATRRRWGADASPLTPTPSQPPPRPPATTAPCATAAAAWCSSSTGRTAWTACGWRSRLGGGWGGVRRAGWGSGEGLVESAGGVEGVEESEVGGGVGWLRQVGGRIPQHFKPVPTSPPPSKPPLPALHAHINLPTRIAPPNPPPAIQAHSLPPVSTPPIAPDPPPYPPSTSSPL